MDTINNFIRAETVATFVKESDEFQFEKYRKFFEKQIIICAKQAQTNTTLKIEENASSYLRDMLRKTILNAGFSCTDWCFFEGKSNCWYEITVSWKNFVENEKNN